MSVLNLDSLLTKYLEGKDWCQFLNVIIHVVLVNCLVELLVYLVRQMFLPRFLFISRQENVLQYVLMVDLVI